MRFWFILLTIGALAGYGIFAFLGGTPTVGVAWGSLTLLALFAILAIGGDLFGTAATIILIMGVFAHFTGVFVFTPVMGLAVPIYLIVGLIYSRLMWKAMLASDKGKEKIERAYTRYEASDYFGKVPFKNTSFYPFGFSKDYPVIASHTAFWPLHMTERFFVLALDGLMNVGTGITTIAKWVGRSVSEIYAGDADKAVENMIKNRKVK